MVCGCGQAEQLRADAADLEAARPSNVSKTVHGNFSSYFGEPHIYIIYICIYLSIYLTAVSISCSLALSCESPEFGGNILNHEP